MSLVNAINRIVHREQCKNCKITWSQTAVDRCGDCKKRRVNHPSICRCQGCCYVFRPTTLDGNGLCGKCANLYDPHYRQGYCSEKNLDSQLMRTQWYVHGVDRVCPRTGKYYTEPNVLHGFACDDSEEEEEESEEEEEESEEEESEEEEEEESEESEEESEEEEDYEGETDEDDGY